MKKLALLLPLMSLFAACQKQMEVASEPPAAATQAEPASAAAPQGGPTGPTSVPTEKAPAVYKAVLTTTKGDVTIEVHRDWAPHGADRFYNMVKSGFLTDIACFRVVDGFMVQFGIHGDPRVMGAWRAAQIPDDASTGHSNSRGMVTFATAGPNTRTTQIFINYGNNANLDAMGFTPFGQVLGDGMQVAESLYKGYGDGPPYGAGPDQGRFQMEGNAYLRRDYTRMDYIKSAKLVQ